MKQDKYGWLTVNGILGRQPKFAEHTRKFQESFKAFGITLDIKYNDEIIYEVSAPHRLLYGGRKPDFVLFWDKDIRLAHTLERDYPVFNSAYCIEVCDDKALTHHHLSLEGVGTPRTIFAPKYFGKSDFPPEEFIDRVIETLGLPLVIKEAVGSFGTGVHLAETKIGIFDTLKKIGGNVPVLFQEFIAASSGRDLRVYVAGGKIVGGVVRENKSDFRAGASSGGIMTDCTLNKFEEKIALAAADAVGATFAGVDILLDGDRLPLVCEVNSNAHFINFLNATGIDFSKIIAQKINEYIFNS